MGVGSFIVEVQIYENFAPRSLLVKVRVAGQARKFAFEVEFVLSAIGAMVEDGVSVVEDIDFGDVSLVDSVRQGALALRIQGFGNSS